MDIADLYPEIRRSCRGIPNPTMRDALLRAARIFCKGSWYVRREVALTLNPAQADPSRYIIPTAANEEPLNILRGQIMDPLSGRFLKMWPASDASFSPNADMKPRMPRWWAFSPASNVIFYYTPDKAYSVSLMVPVQPILGAMTIPDEIGQNYSEGVGKGALSWIFRMRTAEWYDPKESAMCEREFQIEIAKAKVEALKDFKSGDLRVDPVSFGGPRRPLSWT